ncbi:uncharacterized protein J3R85_005371 [Psidium guajava]|nr:uncharacterized protein J3R85_005371 [Psidium guajava]
MYQHNHFKVPEIKSEEGAVHCLQQLLNKIGQDPVLLVLDNVWKESESIVDKFICDGIDYYKIVVTSRYEFPHFCPAHHLNPLTHDEAVELFHRCVTVDDRSMGAPDSKLLNQEYSCLLASIMGFLMVIENPVFVDVWSYKDG